MEGNLSSGGLMPSGSSYGALDLQESMRINHHHQHPLSLQQQHHSQSQQGSIPMNDGFPINMGQIHNCDQSNSVADFNKVDKGKNSVSDEDEPTFNEDGIDGLNDHAKGKKVSFWQRVKWTDSMVRLLITAVSYIGEDAASECGLGGRRKYANLQKKGKWKSVSKVMAERGFYVSPQQCEDKFNDLNKRYKKLNDILGRGTSCQVVENPALLDMMDNLSEKTKDELALRSRDDHETSDSRRHQHDDIDEDDHDAETDDLEEYEDNHNKGTYVITEAVD
ncbi:hypothetical protein Nepgr_024115 [Nepenthes gracilis]|uniref:Myb/SANT-like DNA-binding domain-containing protein n=1 Tax=Nepenthes gracilis TaxID=150966 RepID=A0AAD3XYB1_NEPGR|nr:hypothetical protein Nepgr_024115 [Nepenthes gracilis]